MWPFTRTNFSLKGSVPSRLYRTLSKAEHADDMAKGIFAISTFQKCRSEGNQHQKDAYEGYLFYHSGVMGGLTTDPKVKKVARKSGFIFTGDGVGEVYMAGNIREEERIDAYVLCTSYEDRPEAMEDMGFGKYTVEITDIKKFFSILNNEMKIKYKAISGIAGKTSYSGRKYTGLDSRPKNPTELLKTDIHIDQCEYRFTWKLQEPHRPIKPFIINCPALAEFCKRIR